MSGSYTRVNNTLTVTFELMDDALSLEDLLTPMALKLLNVDGAKSHSGKESVRSSTNPEQNVEKDDEYYLLMINFEFEDVQFLVPRWRFPESSLLNLPPGQDTSASTWDAASAQDFRHLMEFMYPFHSSPLSIRHWVSVLKLSSIWHMYAYREQALSSHGFQDLEPEEKLVLGRLSGIPEWYREGCTGLACGKAQLDACYEATIGIDAMVKIARARDAAYRDTVVSYNSKHKQFADPAPLAKAVHDSLVAEDHSSTTGSSLIDDICTARANGLSKWLLCCYERLIEREESITLEEVATLGLETTIGIWKGRLSLFQGYRHILRLESTQDLNFTKHIEVEFATELEEVRQLQTTFRLAASMIGISVPMDDFFDPKSTYVFINLKFNTVLVAGWRDYVYGWGYHWHALGAAHQAIEWKLRKVDSAYKIVTASNNLHISEDTIHPLICSGDRKPSTFFVARAGSDEPNIYGIFLSRFDSTTMAMRMKAANDYAFLDPWDDGKIEGWKWKIVTVDEAKRHFRVE